MEANTRVASLDYHNMNRAVYLAAESGFQDWKSKFPLPIVIKLERFQNEVLLFIHSLVWFKRLKSGDFSFLYRCFSSIVESFVQLKFLPGYNLDQLSKWEAILHYMLSILAPYARHRLLSSSNRSIMWMHKVDAIFRLADLLQLLNFYHKGGYRNLTERIAHLKVVPRRTLGLLDFETLNRKLMWCVFRDLMVLSILLRNCFWRTKHKRDGEHVDTTVCVECQQRVVIPVKNVTCGHISCYTCYYTEPFCAVCGSVTNVDYFRFLQLSK